MDSKDFLGLVDEIVKERKLNVHRTAIASLVRVLSINKELNYRNGLFGGKDWEEAIGLIKRFCARFKFHYDLSLDVFLLLVDKLPTEEACPTCNGLGRKEIWSPGAFMFVCADCDGTGEKSPKHKKGYYWRCVSCGRKVGPSYAELPSVLGCPFCSAMVSVSETNRVEV